MQISHTTFMSCDFVLELTPYLSPCTETHLSLVVDHSQSALLSPKFNSSSLSLSSLLASADPGPRWAFLIHKHWIPQKGSDSARGFSPGHLCPWRSGRNILLYLCDFAVMYFVVLSELLCFLQKLFSGKDLEQLKSTAKTQFGQVGLRYSSLEFWIFEVDIPIFTYVSRET